MRVIVRSKGLGQVVALRNALRNPGPMLVELSKQLALEAQDQVLECFETQANPYGQAWAPKKRPDGRAILTGKTSRLRNGWKAKPKRIGTYRWRISPSVPYAKWLQQGTKNKDGSVSMVSREMVPDERGFPDTWIEGFREVAAETLRAHFSGVGIRAQKKAHFR